MRTRAVNCIIKCRYFYSVNIYSRSFSKNISDCSKSNIVSSKFPSINIPHIPLNDYIWLNLDKWHDKTALVCAETGRSYTYTEIYKKSRAVANFLHKFKNLKQHDTIAIVLPNVPEYPIVLLGAIEAGLTVTTVNPNYTADEIRKQLIDSDTKLVFTVTNYWANVNKAIKDPSLGKHVPVVVIQNQLHEIYPEGIIKFNDIIQGNDTLEFNVAKSPDDTIVLPYSSGTTGLPKGVCLTNSNIVGNLHQINIPEIVIHNDTEGTHQDVFPGILPMYHIFGLVVTTFNLLAAGCKIVSVPQFGSEIFLKILNEYKPTAAYLVPPIVLMLLNNPNINKNHITQMKTIVSGGAPLGAADIHRLEQKIEKKNVIWQGYGLTETSPTIHQQTSKIVNGVKIGGCGILLPNTHCKILGVEDENEQTLGPHQSGELLVRGPQVMKGYRNNLQATEKVKDSDGWFRTGDIAHYDEDGHFFITDRLKELIKVKGFQVAPAELEELLREHADVEDAAVVGIPHQEYGEIPKAFVVAKSGTKISTSDISNYVASKVSKHKHLKGGVVVLDVIPKSPSGKILRRQLKEL